MQNFKKVMKKFDNFIGVTIPTISFLIIFIVFLIQIVSRYVLRTPVPWTYEISILAYIWTMFFGIGQAIKMDENVVFGLVYDTVNENTKRTFRISYNLLIVIVTLIAFVPNLISMLEKRALTGALQLPFRWMFAPFFLMLVDIIIKCSRNVVSEFIPTKEK